MASSGKFLARSRKTSAGGAPTLGKGKVARRRHRDVQGASVMMASITPMDPNAARLTPSFRTRAVSAGRPGGGFESLAAGGRGAAAPTGAGGQRALGDGGTPRA